jgi:hypothetical protein
MAKKAFTLPYFRHRYLSDISDNPNGEKERLQPRRSTRSAISESPNR